MHFKHSLLKSVKTLQNHVQDEKSVVGEKWDTQHMDGMGRIRTLCDNISLLSNSINMLSIFYQHMQPEVKFSHFTFTLNTCFS